MDLVSVNLQAIGQFPYLAIYTDIHIPFLSHLLKQLLIVTLAIFHQWSQDIYFPPVILFQNQRHYFLDGVLHHLFARFIRIRLAYSSIKQAKEIVDFSGSSYCATRILVDSFLLDGNHRAQAGYLVDVRALHVSEHSSRICRERIDISTLAFGIDSIESKRRLSAAAQPRYNHKLVVRYLYINILEIVNPCSIHSNTLVFCLNVAHQMLFL